MWLVRGDLGAEERGECPADGPLYLSALGTLQSSPSIYYKAIPVILLKCTWNVSWSYSKTFAGSSLLRENRNPLKSCKTLHKLFPICLQLLSYCHFYFYSLLWLSGHFIVLQTCHFLFILPQDCCLQYIFRLEPFPIFRSFLPSLATAYASFRCHFKYF